MWKTVLAGTTALAIAGGTLAYAQQGSSASSACNAGGQPQKNHGVR